MTVNTIYNHSKLFLFMALNEENQQIFLFADFLYDKNPEEDLEL